VREIEELVAKSVTDAPEQTLEPFDSEQQTALIASPRSLDALESHERVLRPFALDPEPAEDRARWVAKFYRRRDGVREWLRRRGGSI